MNQMQFTVHVTPGLLMATLQEIEKMVADKKMIWMAAKMWTTL